MSVHRAELEYGSITLPREKGAVPVGTQRARMPAIRQSPALHIEPFGAFECAIASYASVDKMR